MELIIEDIIKIYLSCIDSYNSKIYQTINEKYTEIDKSMISAYLFIKIIEDRNENNCDITKTLSNYLVKQVIYSETGNLSFEIPDDENRQYYIEILNKMIIEKFEYKNRIMKKLKYDFKNIQPNKYTKLLDFLDNIAEYAILSKLERTGNKECFATLNKIIETLTIKNESINEEDEYFNEKQKIINQIINNSFEESEYGKLVQIALNLKDVYRYSSIGIVKTENVLFHQYTVAIISILLAEYCNKELEENIDIYQIILKSLFHDFSEYKGTEIVTHFKNYNELTKKMFEEIEAKDEYELKEEIGEKLYIFISQYKNGLSGYLVELVDKMLGIIKLLIEVKYYSNYTCIKAINSIYQERFKRFLKIWQLEGLKQKTFYIELLRYCYIYTKENLMNCNLEVFLKYFNQEELEEFKQEIDLLKSKPETFLN